MLFKVTLIVTASVRVRHIPGMTAPNAYVKQEPVVIKDVTLTDRPGPKTGHFGDESTTIFTATEPDGTVHELNTMYSLQLKDGIPTVFGSVYPYSLQDTYDCAATWQLVTEV